MRIYDIIEKKRDGKELSCGEIKFFIDEYCSGNILDYQAAALLMAIFINGMNSVETAHLTEAMAKSGDIIDLSSIRGVKVDKHSTGGVGDKTSLILGPIVAACGVSVAKMSGRGLGHTGGTIDKLEAIPGFKTEIKIDDFIDNVNKIGIAIAGQTGNLAPADKKLYALRDVTATINNISLIASSIMSKKIASGADAIVLDVKTGSGAFMKTMEESIELAKAMVNIARSVDKKAVALITDMDVPLGNAVGNTLEVIEAIDTLKGNGPKDLEEVSLELASYMLFLAGKGEIDYCRRIAGEVICNGKAVSKMKELIRLQGGDDTCVDDYSLFPKASIEGEFLALKDGYIERIITDELGKASMVLGAGRETKESEIDYSAGILLEKKTGTMVKKGDVIARLFTNNKGKVQLANEILAKAIVITENQPKLRPLILSVVE